MNGTYLKLFVDCLEKYQKLNDTEFGRLVRAALRYKAEGTEPNDLGREALLWDGMRLDIDRDNESYLKKSQIRSDAGKRGAEARWKDGKNSKCHLPSGKHGQDKEEDKDQDKEKDQEEIDSSEQSTEPEAAPEGERIITLPLNTGEEYPILRSQAEEWAELYPAVDVLQQLRAMRGWLMANPKKRKTQSGILRFVNGWLSGEQTKGPSAGSRPSRKGGDPPGPTSYDPDKFEADSLYNVPVIVSRSG